MTQPRVLVELSPLNEIALLCLDDEGFVVHEVPIGPVQPVDDLAHLCSENGWLCASWGDEAWFEGNNVWLCDVSPMPITVTFVGGEIAPEEALRLAHENGIPEAIGVLSQKVLPDEGKNLVTFSLAVPRGWTWQ
jgi:hypothetical protein